MKFSTLSLGFLALLTPLTAAWSKEGMMTVSLSHQLVLVLAAAYL